jgi:hypothetical protein
VGSIYHEFEKQLAEGKVRWAGRPREEMLELFLLALEREEIVAIGYRENAITRRLARMPIPPDVREILRHALIWAWKDEEMHAIYIRGAILRLGGPFLRMKAYTRQLAGGVGGWASSVLMHARWSDAPISRTLAKAVTTAGMLMGSVPATSPYLSLTKMAPICKRLWRLTTAALTVFASPSGTTSSRSPRSPPQ